MASSEDEDESLLTPTSNLLYESMVLGKDGTTATAVIRAAAAEQNKNVKLDKLFKAGSRKKWVCTDDNCNWEIIGYRKLKKKGTVCTKLSLVPEGFWYISSITNNVHGDRCTSRPPKMEAKELLNLSGFRAAHVEGMETSKKRLLGCLKEANSVPTNRFSAATVYRQMNTYTQVKNEHPEQYSLIPNFFKHIR